jgi:hypothetical protein
VNKTFFCTKLINKNQKTKKKTKTKILTKVYVLIKRKELQKFVSYPVSFEGAVGGRGTDAMTTRSGRGAGGLSATSGSTQW